MTANLERVRELLLKIRADTEPFSDPHLAADEAYTLLSPAQPPPEPAPRLSDERIRELVDEGAENGRRMAEAAQSMRPLAPPEPAPAEQLRVAVEALERQVWWYDNGPLKVETGRAREAFLRARNDAAAALAKLRPAKGGG